MANVKNVTDLPVAESTDGLNLIVNDSGSAKQIAASAVGAQANWDETDETSPAFIMNKPTISNSSVVVYYTTDSKFYKDSDFTNLVTWAECKEAFLTGTVRLYNQYDSGIVGTMVGYTTCKSNYNAITIEYVSEGSVRTMSGGYNDN